MKNKNSKVLSKSNIYILLIIALSFFVTGSGYLSWLYHLMEYVPASQVDYLTEGIGYLFQVLGMAGTILLYKKGWGSPKSFLCFIFFDCLSIALALFAEGSILTLFFGYVMNLFHGFIAGFYLVLLAKRCPHMHTGFIFGAGYALGTVGSYLFSLIDNGNFLKSRFSLIAYAAFSIILMLIVFLIEKKSFDKTASESSSFESSSSESSSAQSSSSESSSSERIRSERNISGSSTTSGLAEVAEIEAPTPSRKIILLAGLMVLLLSCVKNVGFYFPTADLSSGAFSLEFVRLFYAAGLLIAGIINDRKPSAGALCCMASLILPFVMLSLTAYATISQVLWILGYFFFGFFAVYRIKVFADLSKIGKGTYTCLLAPCGLMIGRLGDVLGTFLGIGLASYLIPFLIICSLLFAVTVFIFYSFYQACILRTNSSSPNPTIIYIPSEAAQSPEEAKEKQLAHFSTEHDLSLREKEVLTMILAGNSNSEIAQKLFVSENTVKFHVRNLLHKTECTNRRELIAKYNA